MSEPLFRASGLSKSYGDIRVLEKFDLEIGYNEIVGIAGENGAGKSTVLKLIAGVVSPSAGTMELVGQPYLPANYHSAVTSGVAMVFQEQALIGNLQIFENIFFGFEDTFLKMGLLLNHARMLDEAQTKLDELGFGHIKAGAVTDDLPFHDRQMVEIARAFILAGYLNIAHPLILLDEPTAAIGEREVNILFDAVRRLRDKASFVIVTHKLSEYIELCDRIYVLKDGSMAGELADTKIETSQVHELMVGRVRDAVLYHEGDQRAEFDAPRLSVSGLNGANIKDVNFQLGRAKFLELVA